MNRQETYQIFNTLACVPMMLQGQSVLVDLRNETSVAGRILDADGYMNITLTEAVYIDQKGLQYPFDEFFVRRRMIRQVILPNYIDALEYLNDFLNKTAKKKNVKREPKHMSRKNQKAYERHWETLEEVNQRRK